MLSGRKRLAKNERAKGKSRKKEREREKVREGWWMSKVLISVTQSKIHRGERTRTRDAGKQQLRENSEL